MNPSNSSTVWFCCIDGVDYGPMTGAELKTLVVNGKLRESNFVWRVGKESRVPASKVRGLFSGAQDTATKIATSMEISPSQRDPSAREAFISYSSQDKITADSICAGLERDRIRCWIAPRDVLPGSNWGEAIIKGIESSEIMVVVLSSASNGSPQVLREVERAVHKGLTIIPFRIESVEMSKSLEFFLSTPHWLDALSTPLEEHIARLSRAVHAVLETSEPSRRASQIPPPIPAKLAAPPVLPAPQLPQPFVGETEDAKKPRLIKARTTTHLAVGIIMCLLTVSTIGLLGTVQKLVLQV